MLVLPADLLNAVDLLSAFKDIGQTESLTPNLNYLHMNLFHPRPRKYGPLLNLAFRKTTVRRLCWRAREQLRTTYCAFQPARNTRWSARQSRWEFWRSVRSG